MCSSIAAASIIAKVYRDELMEQLDNQYPGYDFAIHKGYGTKAHQAALKAKGLSPLHRTSFNLQKFL
jgi:ribonuclease HII